MLIKKLSIVVFGLDMGLPLLSILAKRKFKVLGFDTNLELINDLKGVNLELMTLIKVIS